MATKTTTRLRLSVRGWWILHERPIHNASVDGMFAMVLLLIHALFRSASAPAAPLVPQAHRPIIVIATAQPLPTATPWPTPQLQIVYLAAPTPEPQVVYVQVQSPAEASQEASQAAEQGASDTHVAPLPAPPKAPEGAGPGGSGVMVVPVFDPLPAPQAQTDAERWCAAAASVGKARCVEEEK